jgi:hypothetical protein
MSKTPKPGKSVSKKKTKQNIAPGQFTSTDSPLLSAVEVNSPTDITAEEQKKIVEMVALAQARFKQMQTKLVKETNKEFNTLDSQIKEFMGPYILIGYDLNNNPVEVVSANNTAENDALLERFRRVMFKINQNIMNSNGQDPYGFTP